MQIPVLLEPTATGFRASTQSPVPLSAEGGTESAAMNALTRVLLGQMPNGGKIRTITIPDNEPLDDIFARMRSNPLNTEFDKAIEDYRKVANAVEDAE